jgi:hypothetical protein
MYLCKIRRLSLQVSQYLEPQMTNLSITRKKTWLEILGGGTALSTMTMAGGPRVVQTWTVRLSGVEDPKSTKLAAKLNVTDLRRKIRMRRVSEIGPDPSMEMEGWLKWFHRSEVYDWIGRKWAQVLSNQNTNTIGSMELRMGSNKDWIWRRAIIKTLVK